VEEKTKWLKCFFSPKLALLGFNDSRFVEIGDQIKSEYLLAQKYKKKEDNLFIFPLQLILFSTSNFIRIKSFKWYPISLNHTQFCPISNNFTQLGLKQRLFRGQTRAQRLGDFRNHFNVLRCFIHWWHLLCIIIIFYPPCLFHPLHIH
jgi:hypothetical protein